MTTVQAALIWVDKHVSEIGPGTITTITTMIYVMPFSYFKHSFRLDDQQQAVLYFKHLGSFNS